MGLDDMLKRPFNRRGVIKGAGEVALGVAALALIPWGEAEAAETASPIRFSEHLEQTVAWLPSREQVTAGLKKMGARRVDIEPDKLVMYSPSATPGFSTQDEIHFEKNLKKAFIKYDADQNVLMIVGVQMFSDTDDADNGVAVRFSVDRATGLFLREKQENIRIPRTDRVKQSNA